MKDIFIVFVFLYTAPLLGSDNLKPKTFSTTYYLDSYNRDLNDGKLSRLDVRCLNVVYNKEEKIPAWIALDIITKHQLPGYEVAISLPPRDSLYWDISDEGVKRVVKCAVTKETMPLILAKRSNHTSRSFVDWVAHILSRQSPLDALRAEIMKEYQSSSSSSKGKQYKKHDLDDSLFPLLPLH